MLMLATLFALLLIVVQTALATFVLVRAWRYRPTRLYAYLTTSNIIVIASTLVRDVAPDPAAAYPALAILVIGVSFYITFLMQLLSALFVPQWWEGRRPIIWISLPYFIITALISTDLVLQLGIFTDGARFDDLYRLNYVMPAALGLIMLSFVGQIVSLGILAVAFFTPRHRSARGPIILLALATLFAISLGFTAGQTFGIVARIITLVQTLPVFAVLAYLILGTRLFTPTRAALDMALQSLSEAVAVIDQEGLVTFANPSVGALGIQYNQPLSAQLAVEQRVAIEQLIQGEGGELRLIYDERQFDVSIAPVHDERGVRLGSLLLARDITERAERDSQLEAERARLAATVAQLEQSQRERAGLSAAIRALSLPLIPVLPGVLILPLVGDFSAERISEFIGVLLEGIERRHAHTVLIDLTGLPLLDMTGAQGLLSGISAAALLGARCILVGVRPEVAEALVALGLPLNELATAATLEQAVLARIGRRS
jgi:rsbT co-antagonist protein RsbR